MELKINALTKKYKSKKALNQISASLSPGVYGLLGPNGAGKTTLMRLICNLIKPSEGSVLYNGTEINQLGEAYRTMVGYLPQDFLCYPNFTVYQFLEYIGYLKGLPRSQTTNKIDELLNAVGLLERRNSKTSQLSRGLRQRLGIAQALLNEPAILILDEPTAALDPAERSIFRNLIGSISQNRITLLSTHIVSDVSYIADQILLLNCGALQYHGNLVSFVKNAEGKVWETTVSAQKSARLIENNTVCNIHHHAQGVNLRIIADHCPDETAMLAEPTLEDAYLLYTGVKGGEDYAI
ncbi:ABC transporter ATP-binding protein [Massilicoli timonensis]|uniref:ABC transporter ATP-binding protein n=1 Tax=Massilicoli timonensis TaxID=2015901 RepID=UPI003AAACAAF